MVDAVVFNGLNALDFQDVRQNVIRIPEVSARIHELQRIWEIIDPAGFSFFNFMASDDSIFMRNIKLKSLAAATVQIGLFDRYLKYYRRPQFLVGNSNGDSALLVCVGKNSFIDFVKSSLALKAIRPLQVAEHPLLSGISLTEYAVYRAGRPNSDGEIEHEVVEGDKMDINKIVHRLINDFEVKKFVNIGPGNMLLNEVHHELALSDVQILESIDLDPMLSWFWPGMKRAELAAL